VQDLFDRSHYGTIDVRGVPCGTTDKARVLLLS